jgi:hypothetical protein
LVDELRQGEIITDLEQHLYDPVAQSVNIIRHRYIIILSQDCDLYNDSIARKGGGASPLNGVLIYEAEKHDEFRKKLPSGTDIWKRVRQNNDERYHLLEAVPPELDLLGAGLPNLCVDFKRIFTLPAAEIERQCRAENGARRRCRLEMPYREHLQARAAFYLERVMLPLAHVFGGD